jgi:hypothetical protein
MPEAAENQVIDLAPGIAPLVEEDYIMKRGPILCAVKAAVDIPSGVFFCRLSGRAHPLLCSHGRLQSSQNPGMKGRVTAEAHWPLSLLISASTTVPRHRKRQSSRLFSTKGATDGAVCLSNFIRSAPISKTKERLFAKLEEFTRPGASDNGEGGMFAC